MLRVENLSFGRRIAVHRTALGLTQTAVAHRIYCDRSTISRYERERLKPSDDNLLRLSKLFNIPVEELDPNGRPK